MNQNNHKELYFVDLINLLWKRKVLILIGAFLSTLIIAFLILLSPKNYTLSGTLDTNVIKTDLKHLEYVIRNNFSFYKVIFSDKEFSKKYFDNLLMSFPKDKKNLDKFYKKQKLFKDLDLNDFHYSYFPKSSDNPLKKNLGLTLDIDGVMIVVKTNNLKKIDKYYKLVEMFTVRQMYKNFIDKINSNFVFALQGDLMINKGELRSNINQLSLLKERRKILNNYKENKYLNSQINLSEGFKDFLPASLQLQAIALKINEVKVKNRNLKNIIFDLSLFNIDKLSIVDVHKKRNVFRSIKIGIFSDRIEYVLKKLTNIGFNKTQVVVNKISSLYILLALFVFLALFILITFFLEWYRLNKQYINS